MSKDLFFDEQAKFAKNHAHDQRLLDTEGFSYSLLSGFNKEMVGMLYGILKAAVFEGGDTMFRHLESLQLISKFKEFLTEDKEALEFITSEISKYGKAYVSDRGVKFELAETGTKYDYSLNTEWRDLAEKEGEIKAKKRELEDKLKTIPAGKLLVDSETGETYIGPGKTSKSSYKITLPK